MPPEDSSRNPFDDQVQCGQPNLADRIEAKANKDTRIRPWQGAHEDGQATSQDQSQDDGAKTNGKDEYWMTEGSVNASS